MTPPSSSGRADEVLELDDDDLEPDAAEARLTPVVEG
jgi:hypothetical protein